VTEVGSPDPRREVVRARVSVPVTLTAEGTRAAGRTEDLSEGGAAIIVPAQQAPAAGSVVEASLLLDGGRVWLSAEVIRTRVRRDELTLFVRFLDPSEHEQDLVRGHVFGVLRRLRARGWS
jgi:c-di-GMP-binding flagellar brake protein YcgR